MLLKIIKILGIIPLIPALLIIDLLLMGIERYTGLRGAWSSAGAIACGLLFVYAAATVRVEGAAAAAVDIFCNYSDCTPVAAVNLVLYHNVASCIHIALLSLIFFCSSLCVCIFLFTDFVGTLLIAYPLSAGFAVLVVCILSGD